MLWFSFPRVSLIPHRVHLKHILCQSRPSARTLSFWYLKRKREKKEIESIISKLKQKKKEKKGNEKEKRKRKRKRNEKKRKEKKTNHKRPFSARRTKSGIRVPLSQFISPAGVCRVCRSRGSRRSCADQGLPFRNNLLRAFFLCVLALRLYAYLSRGEKEENEKREGSEFETNRSSR